MNPKIHAVIETAIYVDDLDAAEDFYTNILGLPVIGKEQSRHVFFQVGESNVLLAFLPETTHCKETCCHLMGPQDRVISRWAPNGNSLMTGGSI